MNNSDKKKDLEIVYKIQRTGIYKKKHGEIFEVYYSMSDNSPTSISPSILSSRQHEIPIRMVMYNVTKMTFQNVLL